MVRVLVVGGAGYVGGYLVDQLLSRDIFEVRVVDALLYETEYLKNVSFFNVDVRDSKSLTPHFHWADCVVWLAALVGDGACQLNPDKTWAINFESVRFLAESFRGPIVFTSTCSVYGAQKDLLDENSPINPLSIYAESKLYAEEALLDSRGGAEVFRLGTLFGQGDSSSRLRLDLVLNILTARAVLEGYLEVFGGHQVRPLLHVRDVGDLLFQRIVGFSEGLPTLSGRYNLHKENVTILELAEIIKSKVPGSVVKVTENMFEDHRNYAVSSEKARQVLDFSPEREISDGVKEIAAIISSGRVPDISVPRFSNVAALSRTGADR